MIIIGLAGFIGNLVARGYMLTPQVVLTGSMEPTLSKGDMLFIKRISPDDLNIGEVVAYKRGSVIVVHRIVSITAEGFKTKGDANDVEDPWIVSREDIIGIPGIIVPCLGWFFIGIAYNIYIRLLVGLVGVLLIVLAIFK